MWFTVCCQQCILGFFSIERSPFCLIWEFSVSSITQQLSSVGSRGTERTVVMDKSKGVPVISVKTSGSKERVSINFLTRVFSVSLISLIYFFIFLFLKFILRE